MTTFWRKTAASSRKSRSVTSPTGAALQILILVNNNIIIFQSLILFNKDIIVIMLNIIFQSAILVANKIY